MTKVKILLVSGLDHKVISDWELSRAVEMQARNAASSSSYELVTSDVLPDACVMDDGSSELRQ